MPSQSIPAHSANPLENWVQHQYIIFVYKIYTNTSYIIIRLYKEPLNKIKFDGLYSGATYPWVPNTRVETCPPTLSDPSLANPKSETLARKFLSNRILLLLKSLWITGGVTCSWRYSKPLAASRAIFKRVSQSNFGEAELEPARLNFTNKL